MEGTLRGGGKGVGRDTGNNLFWLEELLNSQLVVIIRENGKVGNKQ